MAPIVLDPTVGGANANAFVAQAYVADLAASSGPAGAAWLSLGTTEKDGTILMATRKVNARRYRGERTTETQRLNFPRTCTIYADDVIPPPVEESTAIEAIALAPQFAAGATVPLFPTPATALQQLKRKKTGPQEKEYFENRSVMAASIQSLTPDAQLLLADLLVEEGTFEYGASTQERTS